MNPVAFICLIGFLFGAAVGFLPTTVVVVLTFGALIYAGILWARSKQSDNEGTFISKFLAFGWIVGICAAWLVAFIRM